MRKKLFEQIKKELMIIGIILILSVLAFKIIFLSESFFVVLRTVAAIFWMFVISGYSLMFYWNEKLNFTERLIIGIVLSAAIIGISSYYLGLIGLNIKHHTIILPLVIILIGVFINLRRIMSKS